MGDETSSRTYVVGDIESQLQDNNITLDVSSTPKIPTSTLPQETPESIPPNSSTTELEVGKKARFAPVRRSNEGDPDLPRRDTQDFQQPEPWLPQTEQYSSSDQHDYSRQVFASPEAFVTGLAPQIPGFTVTPQQPGAMPKPSRSRSLPIPPSHEVEPRPYFYTPQAGNASLSSPMSMIPSHFHSPVYLPQSQPMPTSSNPHPHRRARSAPVTPVSTSKQDRIFDETSRSFVAHDPFGFDNKNLNEEKDIITFDDIEVDLSPIQPNWDRDQLYRNTVMPPWGPNQSLWFQQQGPVSGPTSVPSSWGQLYSPFIPYPMTPYATYAPLDSGSRSPSISTDSQRLSNEHGPGDASQASSSSIETPAPQPPKDSFTADQSVPHSPVGSPRRSPTREEGHASPEVPVSSSEDEMHDYPPSPQNRPPPIIQGYVTVNPLHSRAYGPYTEHFPVDPTNLEPQVYPYYFQAGNGPVYPRAIATKPPETPSFSTKLKDIFRWPFSRTTSHTRQGFQLPYYADPSLPTDTRKSSGDTAVQLIAITIPRQIYLHFLLRLPSLYFSRVARIFEEADFTLREIKKMALETGLTDKGLVDLHTFETKDLPPQYTKLKSTWEAFIDSVMREWKTFNIISVLLLSAILTILQIQSAAENTITRYTALSSLICSLISLLFGCTYIIRFGTMRRTYKAAEWALEARQTRMTVWWNVWVLLAMPAIWLTWSIILYIVCIMSFVWQTSVNTDQNPSKQISAKTLLAVRVIMSGLLSLGILYGGLILTTFRRYGQVMDRSWQRRINNWIIEKRLRSQWANYGPNSGYSPWPQTPMYGGPRQAMMTPSGWYGPQTPYQDTLPPPPQVPWPYLFPRQFQFPETTPAPPTPTSILSPLASVSAVGYFSDYKTFDEGDLPSLFVPETDISDGEEAAASPTDVVSSVAQFSTGPTPLPPVAEAPTSAVSSQDMGPSIVQNNEPDPQIAAAGPVERINENRPRTVRFRSPLVSPEVPQFASSISDNDNQSVDSLLVNLPDTYVTSSTTTTTSTQALDEPESSTSIPQPKDP